MLTLWTQNTNKQTNKQMKPQIKKKKNQKNNQTKPQLTISDFFLKFVLVIEDLFPNGWE